jgi:hypothetical protein
MIQKDWEMVNVFFFNYRECAAGGRRTAPPRLFTGIENPMEFAYRLFAAFGLF